MSIQDEYSSHITYNNILELYQTCRKNGDWAKVYLETRGGNQFFTISVNVSAGSTAGTTSGVEKESRKKKKKPGQVRRDKIRRAAFLERRQAAKLAEEARKDEIGNEPVEKSGEVDTKAGETSSEGVDKLVEETSPVSSKDCTWDIGVEAPSPGSSRQSTMSIDSDTEKENEILDQHQVENIVVEKTNKWRIKVESEDIEKLEEHVRISRDSKVFRCCSLNPIVSVESILPQLNALVLDVSIDSDQFCISFIENKHNWPIFVTNVKRVSKL